MRRDVLLSLDDNPWYATGPFLLVYAALGLVVTAIALTGSDATLFVFVRVALILAGLLCSGGAIWWRLANAPDDDFDERSKSGVLVALASGPVLAAYAAMDADWDSMQLFLIVMWVVNLLAVPLVLMPSMFRRITVSFAILFHFGAILTAVTAVQLPNNAAMPWLPTVAWHKIYRHYVTFAYMNNAYHFYSPDPGPPQLLWFQVRFEDGTTKWIRLPQREDWPTRQQYQRFLSLTELTNTTEWVPDQKMAQLTLRRNLSMSRLWENLPRRVRDDFNDPDLSLAPTQEKLKLFASAVAFRGTYLEPNDLAKKYIRSYARHVARSTKSDDDPDLKVRTVRVYRLTHNLIYPLQLAEGLEPTDPTFYNAFYLGEFDTEGQMVWKPGPNDRPLEFDMPRADGAGFERRVQPPQDPFLYWHLPIYRVLKPGKEGSRDLNDFILIDYLYMHSGSLQPWDEAK